MWKTGAAFKDLHIVEAAAMKGSMPGDPSSPTRMEAGNLQGGGMPLPAHQALEVDKEVVVGVTMVVREHP